MKRHAGILADDMPQRAADAASSMSQTRNTQRRLARLIRRQDPQHLGDFFERKMDLEIEREFQHWADAEVTSYFDELNAKVKAILETEDIQLPTGELIESGGRLSPITRSAKELLVEMDGDAKASDVIMNCKLRG